MKKNMLLEKIVLGFLFLFLFLFAEQATAGNVMVTDINQSDASRITGLTLMSDHTDIYENYGETYLVPYPSHDGMGVVNSEGGFFDKLITNTGVIGGFVLDFFVTNTGPYTWSDYHFEFWNADFTQRLDVTGILFDHANFGPGKFQNSSVDLVEGGTMVSWWAPEWQAPGEMQQLNLYLTMDLLPNQFGIRQVATTTVPTPSAFLLLGSGLIGLVGFRRKFRKI